MASSATQKFTYGDKSSQYQKNFAQLHGPTHALPSPRIFPAVATPEQPTRCAERSCWVVQQRNHGTTSL